MVVGGKTLYFDQGNTHEGMKWTIIDKSNKTAIDITGASINCLVQDESETTTIINRSVTVISAIDGTCKLVPITGEMDDPGVYKVQLDIIFADTTVGVIQNMFINIKSKLTA